VLDCKQAQQYHVHEYCLPERAFGAGVDGLGHPYVADEADSIQEGDHKDQITNNAISEYQPFFNHMDIYSPLPTEGPCRAAFAGATYACETTLRAVCKKRLAHKSPHSNE
jgi:hypothetical protein